MDASIVHGSCVQLDFDWSWLIKCSLAVMMLREVTRIHMESYCLA